MMSGLLKANPQDFYKEQIMKKFISLTIVGGGGSKKRRLLLDSLLNKNEC